MQQTRIYGALGLGAFLTTALIASGAQAADVGHNASVSGIVIGTYQHANESEIDGQDVDDEGNAQLYLFGQMDMGPGTWNLEVRGGTTPHDNGVTSFYGEVNDSVGETLDSDGSGRIAATQFYYALPVANGELSVGLLDATGLLDANDIADDEYTQFMGTSFVNNPSIDYPSFALGANYLGEVSSNLGYQVFVSSSGGLEDEDDPSYSNVVDVGEDGKGVFTGGELLWQALGLNGDVGVWYNSADHSRLDNPASDDHDNYGAYASAGAPVGPGQWVAWAGIANEHVSAAANFLGLAYAQDIGDATLGAGIARIGVSDDQPEPADSIVQAEVYVRVHIIGNAYITPDLQYVENSGFDADRDGTLIAGLRGGIEF